MNSLKVLGLVVLGFLAILGVPKGSHGDPGCNQFTYPVDRTETLQRGDLGNCGESIWELEVQFGQLWDEGEYDGMGTCTGGYVDCNCNNVAAGYKAPSLSFQSMYVQPDEYEWWWDITEYDQAVLSACTSGACESAGYKESVDSFIDYNQGWDDENCLY